MLRRTMVALLALAVVAAACSDDDGDLSGSEQAVVDAIMLGMTEDGDSVDDPFSDPEAARCVAEGVVRYLGVERLAEVGITAELESPEEAFARLSDAEIDSLIDLSFECVDVEAEMAEQFSAEGLSEGSAACVVDVLADTDFFREAFRAGMTGDDTYDPTSDPEFLTVMMEAFTGCLTADELARFMGG